MANFWDSDQRVEQPQAPSTSTASPDKFWAGDKLDSSVPQNTRPPLPGANPSPSMGDEVKHLGLNVAGAGASLIGLPGKAMEMYGAGPISKALGIQKITEPIRQFGESWVDKTNEQKQQIQALEPESIKAKLAETGYNVPKLVGMFGAGLPQVAPFLLGGEALGGTALAYGAAGAALNAPETFDSTYRTVLKNTGDVDQARDVATATTAALVPVDIAANALGLKMAGGAINKVSGPISKTVAGAVGFLPAAAGQAAADTAGQQLATTGKVDPDAVAQAAKDAVVSNLPIGLALGAHGGYEAAQQEALTKRLTLNDVSGTPQTPSTPTEPSAAPQAQTPRQAQIKSLNDAIASVGDSPTAKSILTAQLKKAVQSESLNKEIDATVKAIVNTQDPVAKQALEDTYTKLKDRLDAHEAKNPVPEQPQKPMEAIEDKSGVQPTQVPPTDQSSVSIESEPHWPEGLGPTTGKPTEAPPGTEEQNQKLDDLRSLNMMVDNKLSDYSKMPTDKLKRLSVLTNNRFEDAADNNPKMAAELLDHSHAIQSELLKRGTPEPTKLPPQEGLQTGGNAGDFLDDQQMREAAEQHARNNDQDAAQGVLPPNEKNPRTANLSEPREPLNRQVDTGADLTPIHNKDGSWSVTIPAEAKDNPLGKALTYEGKTRDEAMNAALTEMKNKYAPAINDDMARRQDEAERLKPIVESQDINRIVDEAKDTNPHFQKVADLVKSILGKANVEFRVPEVGDKVPYGEGVRGAHGLTKEGKSIIWLSGASSGLNAGDRGTLAHELVHAATALKVQQGNLLKNRGTELGKAVLDLHTLWRDLVNSVEDSNKADLPKIIQDFRDGKNDTLTDKDELLAWGMTDARMQDFLKSHVVESGKPSWWQQLLEKVSNILGAGYKAPVKPDVTALDRLLDINKRVMESKEPQSTKDFIRENPKETTFQRQVEQAPDLPQAVGKLKRQGPGYYETPEGYRAELIGGRWKTTAPEANKPFGTFKTLADANNAIADHGQQLRSLNLQQEKPLEDRKWVLEGPLNKVNSVFGDVLKGTPAQKVVDGFMRTFTPEMFGPKALRADVLVAQYKVKLQNAREVLAKQSQKMVENWDKVPKEDQRKWLQDREEGKLKADDPYNQLYQASMDKVFKQEREALGDRPQDAYYRESYIPHLFEKPDAFRQWFIERTQKLGPNWFMKERSFDFLRQAEDAGFKLKTYNPEELRQLRMQASSDMIARHNLLQGLVENGVAARLKDLSGKGEFDKVAKMPQALKDDLKANGFHVIGPDGKTYVIHNETAPLWDNAMNSAGLWEDNTAKGSIYRGWQSLRNAWIPIKLGMSLFHPAHVATIHVATGLAGAAENMIKGGNLSDTTSTLMMGLRQGLGLTKGINPLRGGFDFNGLGDHPYIQALKTAPADRTPEQAQVVARFEEGGFTPLMAERDRIEFRRNLIRAVNQPGLVGKGKIPLGLLQGALRVMSSPFFEHWIPGLKAEAYMRLTQNALNRNPALLADAGKRAETFRGIAKDLERTYGEMNYDTLFWKKMVRDATTGSFLSAGWKLAQLYYYSGFAKAGALGYNTLKTGRLDPNQISYNMLFSTAYGALSLMAGAYVTKLAGQEIKDLKDMIFPKDGTKRKDGTANRLQLPFFNKELYSLRNDTGVNGLIGGGAEFVWNQTVLKELIDTIRNKDSFGRPLVSDPTSIDQIAHAAWQTIMPISMDLSQRAELKHDKVAAVASYFGVGLAPEYAGRTQFENKVVGTYFNLNPSHGSTYQHDMKDQYKIALLENDKNKELELKEKLKQTGMSQSDINDLRTQYTTPFPKYAWEKLPAEEQIRLFRSASDEEKATYYKDMNPSARKQVDYKPVRVSP